MGQYIVSLYQPGVYNPNTNKALVYTLYEPGSGDSDYILNSTLKLEVNKAGSFEFDILPSHTYYTTLRRYIHYVCVKEVDDPVYSDRIVFYGRILTMNLSFNGMKHVVCEGLMANLLDCPMYCTGMYYGGMTPDKMFLVKGSPSAMFSIAIDAYRNRIRTDIECGWIHTDANDYSFEDIDVSSGTSVGDFITSELVEAHGGFLQMRYREDIFNGDIIGRLEWNEDPTMSAYDVDTINQVIEFGVNMLDISGESTDDDIMTGIIPMWTDGNNDKHWATETDYDVDDSERQIYMPKIYGASGGLNAVGIKVVELPGVTDSTTAESYATNYVNKYCSNYIFSEGSAVDFDSYTIRALDLHYIGDSDKDRIDLYSPVRIKCGPRGIDRVLTCTAIEIIIDSPENSSYTFSVYRPKASSNDKTLARQLKRKRF